MSSQKSMFAVKIVKVYYFVIDSFLRRCAILPLKNVILRVHGAKIGKGVTIYPGVSFMGLRPKCFKNLIIKDNVSIGTNTLLDVSSKLVIGNRVVISPRVNVITHTTIGKGNVLSRLYPSQTQGVEIKDNVYIGTAATILDGSVIGERSVIAAASLVRGNVKPGSLYAGVPAVFKKKLKI